MKLNAHIFILFLQLGMTYASPHGIRLSDDYSESPHNGHVHSNKRSSTVSRPSRKLRILQNLLRQLTPEEMAELSLNFEDKPLPHRGQKRRHHMEPKDEDAEHFNRLESASGAYDDVSVTTTTSEPTIIGKCLCPMSRYIYFHGDLLRK